MVENKNLIEELVSMKNSPQPKMGIKRPKRTFEVQKSDVVAPPVMAANKGKKQSKKRPRNESGVSPSEQNESNRKGFPPSRKKMGNSSKDDSTTDGDTSGGDSPPSNSSLYSEGEKVLAYHGPRIYEAKAHLSLSLS